MLIEPLLEEFQSWAPEKYRTLGASSAGSCGRRLAYSHWPEAFPAAPMSARRRMRMVAGKAWETHVVGVLTKRAPANVAGETAFLWPVPVDHETMAMTVKKITEGRVSGYVLPDFDVNDIPRYRAACLGRGMTRWSGIVADPRWNVVFLPALADMIGDDPRYGLLSAEYKTISTAGFRRVMAGYIDYSYRVQCAVQVDAARVDTHALLFYRIETSHAIEIVYSRKINEITVEILLSNGQQRVGRSNEPMDDDAWDAVKVETPFDESLLEQARARIRRALLATPDTLPAREYGPSFVCPKCEAGVADCSHCKLVDGVRVSVHSKKGNACKVCDAGKVTCGTCGGRGSLDEAPLKFPCTFCPYVEPCYGSVARFEMPVQAFGKPKYLVTREAYEASGITVTSPEGT